MEALNHAKVRLGITFMSLRPKALSEKCDALFGLKSALKQKIRALSDLNQSNRKTLWAQPAYELLNLRSKYVEKDGLCAIDDALRLALDMPERAVLSVPDCASLRENAAKSGRRHILCQKGKRILVRNLLKSRRGGLQHTAAE